MKRIMDSYKKLDRDVGKDDEVGPSVKRQRKCEIYERNNVSSVTLNYLM